MCGVLRISLRGCQRVPKDTDIDKDTDIGARWPVFRED